MLKRVFIGLIFLTSLGWIGYVGFNIFTNGNDYSPEHIFNAEDGDLLIVNRSDEINFSQIDDFLSAPLYNLATTLSDSLYETGYFSSQREHLLLQGKSQWNEDNIRALFAASGSSISFDGTTFQLGDLKGRFRRSNLYVSAQEYTPSRSPLKFEYDKKSTVSVLHMTIDRIESVSDIYFKSNGKVDYITYNDEIEQGKQVGDELLFAAVIPKSAKNYHFLERDYAASNDSIFANGPMFGWMQNGFVSFTYGGSLVIISDYIDGQDPILILNDLQQTQEEHYFKTPLESWLKESQGYHIKYLEDFVVISERESVCDQVIADYQIGNTIALNTKAREQLFSGLPKAISERHILGEERISRAVYNGYLLETHLGGAVTTNTANEGKSSIAMACNFEIADFTVLPANGNVIALGKRGQLVGFSNGKEQWRKEISEAPLGNLQVIDLHGNGESHLLVNTEDAIYLWDTQGNAVNGFPIKLEATAQNEVKFYRWKGKSYFLIGDSESRVLHYDARGRELAIFKLNDLITEQIDVWASQGKLFAGFRFGDKFEMFSMSKQRSHRTFDVPKDAVSAKIPNELLHFGLNSGQLVKINQQGSPTNFKKYGRSKIIGVHQAGKNPTVILQSANELHLVNQEGIPFAQVRVPFNEIADISYNALNSGKTIIAIIDGLENNVYLYTLSGEPILDRSLEGKGKVLVKSNGSGLQITTIVDQFLVQYLEN